MKRMLDFVNDNGGRVRFDRYMAEHLYGEKGYFMNGTSMFSSEKRWRSKHKFNTYAMNPDFAVLIHAYVRSLGLDKLDFVELAGGEGTFARKYRELDPAANYLSCDISPSLAEAQGGVVASVSNLPISDESITGVVFANELLDNIPCRVFWVARRGRKMWLGKEAYVVLGKTIGGTPKLSVKYQTPEDDDFFREYQQFMRDGRAAWGGNIYSVSPELPVVLDELVRVLSQGRILLFDYGYVEERSAFLDRKRRQEPYVAMPWGKKGLRYIVNHPYETDVTHNVDFEFVKHLLSDMDFSLKHQSGLFGDVISKNGLNDFMNQSEHPLRPDYAVSAFKVVEIVKS